MLQLAPAAMSPSPVPQAPGRLDLVRLARLLGRQRPLVAAGLLAGLALGGLAAALVAPRYRAEVLLLVDPRKSPVLARQDASGERQLDPGLVESQVEILKSDGVALAAVRRLGLADDPGFQDQGPGRLAGPLAGIVPGPPEAEGREARERRAVERLTAATRARRVAATYVLRLDYADVDPVRAAAVANALAEAYAEGEAEARAGATRRAGVWLQGRLAELREQVSAADLSVQAFKARNNLVDTARGPMGAQQLADVNAQLVAARAATAEAAARLDRVLEVSRGDIADGGTVSGTVSGTVGGTVAEALRSEVVTRLRAQYLDHATRLAELTDRYGAGSDHAAVVAVRAQMAQIERSAGEELRRLAEAARSDHRIALSREESLRRSLEALVAEGAAAARAQVDLRHLESGTQALRGLYDTVLQRHEEAVNEAGVPSGAARVITPAAVPLRPASPGPVAILAAGALLGALGGAALALARETFAAGLRRPEALTAATGLACLGVLPEVAVRARRPVRPDPARLGDGDPLARHALEAPASRFAETLRAAALALDEARGGRPVVLGIVSALPGEGKSSVAANLALLLAAAGNRTLLVDADPRGPGLTRALAPGAAVGLADVLRGECALADALRRDGPTGLDFLPALPAERPDAAPGLLASPAMAALVAAARAGYACVVIDLPPLVPVVDVRAAGHLFDHLLAVVAWGRTGREAAGEAFAGLGGLRRKLIGALLNRADPRALARDDAYLDEAYRSAPGSRPAASWATASWATASRPAGSSPASSSPASSSLAASWR